MTNEGTVIEHAIADIDARIDNYSKSVGHTGVAIRIELNAIRDNLQSMLPAEKEQLEQAYDYGRYTIIHQSPIEQDFDTFYNSIKK